MGPIWGWKDPGGPHVGPVNLAIWDTFSWSATALCNSVGIDANHISVSGLYRCVAYSIMVPTTLQWRHNDHDCVSNHQPHGCLFNCLFRRRSKKTSNLRVTGLCVGNSPGPVNSLHKGPVTRKMFPFDDVIMMHHLRYMCTQSLFRSNQQNFCEQTQFRVFANRDIKVWKSIRP